MRGDVVRAVEVEQGAPRRRVAVGERCGVARAEVGKGVRLVVGVRGAPRGGWLGDVLVMGCGYGMCLVGAKLGRSCTLYALAYALEAAAH